MNFDSSKAIQRATGRAKSDVANKLVSMFLHEASRKACLAGGMFVSDSRYGESVISAFGHRCLYCNRDLEPDRSSVEHLDGMNRFRVGLHVPGNVAMACRRCNNEKRRDDQTPNLSLASTGWQSFLAHDGKRCIPACKTCAYWVSIWPDSGSKDLALVEARDRIHRFQEPYSRFIAWSSQAKPSIQDKVETLYRDCQQFATSEIEKLISEINFDFTMLTPHDVK